MIVNFFILQTQDDRSYLQFVSTKIKLYYQDCKTIVIYSKDKVAKELDELLWFDKDDCFIPHFHMGRESLEYIHLPVLLISDESLLKNIKKDILINLRAQVVSEYERFEYLVKIVDQQPLRLQESRRFYKELQQKAITVNIHKH